MLLKGSFCISETKQTFWALFQMIQLTSKLCDWNKLQEIRFNDNDLAMAQNGTKKNRLPMIGPYFFGGFQWFLGLEPQPYLSNLNAFGVFFSDFKLGFRSNSQTFWSYTCIWRVGLGNTCVFSCCSRGFLPFFSQGVNWKLKNVWWQWSIRWEGLWRLKWLPSEHVLRPWRTGGLGVRSSSREFVDKMWDLSTVLKDGTRNAFPWCSNPFCKWFWSGFWVPKLLLTGYLEH